MISYSSIVCGLVIALVILMSAPLSFAQQVITGATVSGRAVDPSGAVVPNAVVFVRNTDTNQRWEVKSGSDGGFRFRYLPVGNYELRITAPDFAEYRQALAISAGQAFELAAQLRLPNSTTTIEITESAPLIETRRTQAAALVPQAEIESLPLNGRNYLDLTLLVPGVSRTNTGAPQRFVETSAVPGTGVSISGQRNLNNSFIVDGLSANDDAAELAGTFFSQEVIREFQVVTSGGVAEFGRASSGIINITTNAGTNSFHGNAYGFLRNQRLDAQNALSGTKLPLTQGQYGATLGGPVVKDKTFFFGNFEQTRQNSAGVITIAPGNVAGINSRLSAVGYQGPLISTGEFPTTLHTTNFFLRGDQYIGNSEHLTARYSLYDVNSANARNVGGLSAISRGADLQNRDNTIALNNIWTISPTWLNETRVQYTHSSLSAPVSDLQGPAVNISGVASFGTATFSPTARDINLFEVESSLSFAHSKHTFKGGGDFLRNGVRIDFPGALQGVYTFSTLANFLTGNYVNFQQAFGGPTTQQGNPNVGMFLQDEWRVRHNVTLNLGMRYDLQFLPSLVNTDTNNVSPRVGFAWDPMSDEKTVIRGSYGVYYDPIPLRAVSNALQRDGVNYKVAVVTAAAAGAPVFPNVMPAFPAGILTNITTMDANIGQSSSQQANLQIERQVANGFSAAIGYTHLRGEGLIMSRNLNVPTTTNAAVFNLGRPNPSFANNGQFQSVGDSWYDGMTVSLNKRPGRFGSMRLSYTLSKALDTSGNFFFSTPQDNNDIAAEKGRSDNDQRHTLVFSGTLNSPKSKGDGVMQRLGSDWLFSYLYAYSSALPFNILTGTDRNGDTNVNDRPVGVGRNTGEGFGAQSLDLRVGRTFKLAERCRMETLVDAFNVLNHRNNQLPNNVFGTGAFPIAPRPTFGQATAVGDPRQVQLGLRLLF
ncbi:MAG: hypothetical protein JWO13_1395 [Acidobacteriales bacterium]|nr:hypothetical protein [Terriglobales bacterium]